MRESGTEVGWEGGRGWGVREGICWIGKGLSKVEKRRVDRAWWKERTRERGKEREREKERETAV